MTLRLGAIADDYTGASDLANTISKAGLRTVQTIGVPDPALPLGDVEAVVVSLKSRSIPAPEAVAQSLAADRWLRAHGAAHVLFKVCSTFDSTDAGNIGPVTAALKAASGDRIVLVTPAFPETGRTVYQGHLFVGAQLLSDSPLKDHPLNPMHDANLVRVLGRQADLKVGLVDCAVVRRGTAAIRDRLDTLARGGAEAAVIDVLDDAELPVIAEAALDHRLSVGASGLGLGLTRVLAARRGPVSPSAPAAPASKIGGPILCIAGSCSQATLAQIEAAGSHMPVIRLDAAKLVTDRAAPAQTLAASAAALAQGALLVCTSAAPQDVAALQSTFGREASGRAIERALADLAAALVAKGVRRLVVAGGETSGAIVDRLGLGAFAIGREIAPGVPLMRTLGRPDGDMSVVLKSGNFGGPAFFQEAIAMA
jgi:uncharacterized protein YgbK (DUF1537 family)